MSDLPKGWVQLPLEDSLELLMDYRGRTPKKLGMDWGDGSIPALSALNVRHGHIDKKRTKHFGSIELFNTWMTQGPTKKGDVLLTSEAPLGNVAQIPDNDKYILSQRVFLLRTNNKILNSNFLARQMSSPQFQDELTANDSGTTVKGIRQSRLVKIATSLPPLPEQKRIVEKLDTCQGHIDRSKSALDIIPQLLEDYRASLLAKAFNGELTADLPSRQAGWRDSTFRNLSDKLVPEQSDSYFTYVLECLDGSLYKGQTQDLFARIDRHIEGRGSKWTQKNKPVSLIYFEQFDSLDEAIKREKYFKSGSGREKINKIRIAKNKKHESAEDLLTRLRQERRTQWQKSELTKYEAKGKTPPKGWEERYKAPVEARPVKTGNIPIGWAYCSPRELATNSKYSLAIGPFGSNLKVSDYRTQGTPLVFVREVRARRFHDERTKYISHEKAKELSAHAVNAGDILITKMGDPPGDVAILPSWRPRSVITADCIKITHDETIGLVDFFFWALQSPTTQEHIRKESKGVAQKKLSLKRFESVSIPIAPIHEQQEIVTRLEAAFKRIEAIKFLHADLTAQHSDLTQSILTKAFLGLLVPQKDTP